MDAKSACFGSTIPFYMIQVCVQDSPRDTRHSRSKRVPPAAQCLLALAPGRDARVVVIECGIWVFELKIIDLLAAMSGVRFDGEA